MNIKDILIVGVALAMDAFGVTISIGLNKRVNRSKKIGFIISFALFLFCICYYYIDDEKKKKLVYTLFGLGVLLIIIEVIYTMVKIN